MKGKNVEQEQLKPRYTVVEQLKKARKEQQVTQAVLAERVGTQKSNISRFESGKYNPSLDFLIKVADCLGKELRIQVIE
jgi:transcriptional regulator with XRE-family HTH domain